MKRITWFKDICGDVYIWNSEVVPAATLLDTADFCINQADNTIKGLVPAIETADVEDWNWVDMAASLYLINGQVSLVALGGCA